MKKSIRLFILFCFFCVSFLLRAQTGTPEQAVLVTVEAALQFPGGSMASRFGTNYSIGVGAGYKTSANWIFNINAHYLFGNQVKNIDQILSPILTRNSNIFNQTGNYAELSVYERGVYGLVEASKVFHQWGVNKNSGPVLSLGAGYLFHWISFDNPGNDSPQIQDDYQDGYDRLSAGPLLKQSLGYQYLSGNRRINFKISFEILEGFTHNLRGINYDTGKVDNEQHLDLLYGVRLSWYLPIYSKSAQEYYYD